MRSRTEAARELSEILRLAGAEWLDRPWTVAPARSPEGSEAIEVEAPSFCYFWEGRDSPVEVAFVANGPVQTGPARTLVIEIETQQLRVHIPGRPPLVFDSIDSAIHDRIADLPAELVRPASGDRWQGDLRLTGAAMRLAVLAGDAARKILKPGTPRDRNDRMVDEFHAWLGQRLAQPVKLADAAEQLDRSPRQILRMLKQATGAGFSDHVAMRRLTHARALLTGTDRSVMAIAGDCGFNSREQFIRSFNRIFGWTPLQFRKAWRRASTSGAGLSDLCRVLGREEVSWKAEATRPGPTGDSTVQRHTLVVGNALDEVVELFRLDSTARPERQCILESGAMAFIHRDHGGSLWRISDTGRGRSAIFRTPEAHALAVIAPEVFQA